MNTIQSILRVILIEPPLQWLLATLLFSYGMEKRRDWKLWYIISFAIQMIILTVLIEWHRQTGAVDMLRGYRFTTFFVLLDFLTLAAMGRCSLRELLLRFVGIQALQNTLWTVYTLILIPTGQAVEYEYSSYIMLTLIILLYGLCFYVFRPHLNQKLIYHNFPVLLIAVLSLYLKDFLIDTPISGLADIAVNLLAMGIMFDLFQERKLQQQVEVMEQILRNERKQHELAKEEIDIINRKCHDFKHQLLLLSTDASKNLNEFISEAERDLDIYDSSIKTGNDVLDVVLMEKQLYCKEYRIDFTYLADGKALTSIEPSDIASLFGNVLDNAIEYVKTLPSAKRTIRLRVARTADFLCIHCENPYEGTLVLHDGLPQTNKADKENHGFGVLSIDYITKKYNGVCSIRQQQGNFVLNILVPVD